MTNIKSLFIDSWLHSRRVQYIASLVLTLFITFVIMRISFYLYFGSVNEYLDAKVFFQAIYIGFKFDLRLAILTIIPLLFLEIIPKQKPIITNIIRKISQIYLVIAFTSIVLIYILDFGYYAYLNEHINVVALQFLDDAAISAHMVWESYPVIWIAVLLSAAVFIFTKIIQTYIYPVLNREYKPVRKFGRILGSIIFGLMIIFSAYGKISWYPLRWSDGFFSSIPFANALATNPVLFFYDTMKNKQNNYDKDAAEKSYPIIAKYLGIDTQKNAPLDYRRTFPSDPIKQKRAPNIIYVILESLDSNQLGLFGNTLNSTPNLDKLGRKGLVFDTFCAPTSGNTARSVFTTITGIPDVSTKSSASHNPLIIEQHVIMNEFKAYEKYYFLGGSANWRNIRGFLTHNIDDLQLYEEGSYTEPRVDTWGISDLGLFREASKVFKKRNSDKPFIAVIQTSANHRPFTIPKDNEGFKFIDLPDNKKERQGYLTQGRYNAVRFMDHSVGKFMEMIRNEDYFNNTIFVFHGDHGSTSGPSPHMSKAYNQLGLNGFMVPLIIYAPHILKTPKRISLPASQVDVFPTLAALAGIPYTNKTLGRDLLNPFPDKEYYIPMMSNFRPQGLIGVMGENFLLWHDNQNRIRLHDLNSENPKENVKDKHPETTKKLNDLVHAMFETERYMLHYNKHEKHLTDEQQH